MFARYGLESEQPPVTFESPEKHVEEMLQLLRKDTPRTVPSNGHIYVGPTGDCKQTDIAFLMRLGNHITPDSAPQMFRSIRPKERI